MAFDAPDFRDGAGHGITGDVEINPFSNVARLVLPFSPAVSEALRGLQGPPGQDGKDGEDGMPGPPGPSTPGTPGPQGVQGIQGAPGQDGAPGEDGAVGPPGSQGIQGIQGVQGQQGIQGAPGQDGKDGEDGGMGPPGIQGVQGIQGIQGATGSSGPPGQDGKDGEDGQPGPPGQDGARGATGSPGPPGQDGTEGPQGEQGPPGTSAEKAYSEQIEATPASYIDYALSPIADALSCSAGAGAGEYIFHSLVGGFNGRRVRLRASSAGDGVILKDQGSGTAGNLIRCPNSLDFRILAKEDVVLVYNSGNWEVEGASRARDWQNTSSVTWAAQQNDLNITGKDRLRVQLTGAQTLTGMVPRAASTDNDGQTILIENRDDVDSLTLAHQSASSSANNQVACPNNVDFVLGPRSGVVLRYDGTSLAWRIIGSQVLSQNQIGEIYFQPSQAAYHHIVWTDEDFSSNAFRGSAGGSFFNIWAEGTNGGYWNGLTVAGGTGSITRPDNTIGHNGIAVLTTTATNGMSCALLFTRDVVSVSSSEAVLDIDDVISMDMYVMIPTITTMSAFLGLFNDCVPANVTEGVFFQYIAGNANWRSVTESGNVQTDTNISTVTAGNWYKLSIVRAPGTALTLPAWDFYINNVKSSTRHTANITTGGVVPAIVLRNDTATAHMLQVDRIRICVNDAAMFT